MANEPKRVAVITRTKDRALTLQRTMRSICAQTFGDLLWVVVNDGGETAPVDEIVEQARAQGVAAKVVHQAQSGRWRAANVGVEQSGSDYLVLLDDDDTWDPEFLRVTTDFLDANPEFGGVVAHTRIINEIIEGTQIRTLDSHVYNADLASVYMIDMARRNLFPPHSFLYRRSVQDRIGAYDDSLPVMADWELQLRMIEHYDIAVIPKVLANWHLRAKSQGAFGNTVMAGGDKHVLYDALIRNRLLRRDLDAGRLGIGVLASLGRQHNQEMIVLDHLQAILDKLTRIARRSGIGSLINRFSRSA